MNMLEEDILGRADPAAVPGMARFFRTGLLKPTNPSMPSSGVPTWENRRSSTC